MYFEINSINEILANLFAVSRFNAITRQLGKNRTLIKGTQFPFSIMIAQGRLEICVVTGQNGNSSFANDVRETGFGLFAHRKKFHNDESFNNLTIAPKSNIRDVNVTLKVARRGSQACQSPTRAPFIRNLSREFPVAFVRLNLRGMQLSARC